MTRARQLRRWNHFVSKLNLPSLLVLMSMVQQPYDLALAAPLPPAASQLTIVLDPGHGGIDDGATFKDRHGKIYREKDLTLKLAIALRDELKKQNYPVFLTRSKDEDLSLDVRTKMANRMKAKVFISLHLNSSQTSTHSSSRSLNAKESGIETYILNQNEDQTSKRLAELENKGASLGSQLPGEVGLIIKDLVLSTHYPQSKKLALMIQKDLSRTLKVRNRGVKQALFYVLIGAEMPAVLLEAGFIQNEADRDYLLKPQLFSKLVKSLALSIKRYRLQAAR